MISKPKYSWLLSLVLVSVISAELQYICEVCSCDNSDQPKMVNCDGKQLMNLTNLFFNGTIEKLTFMNNSLTLHSEEDLHLINNLTSLKYLDLSKNPLATIPSLSLENLEYLDLNETELTSISFPLSFENSTKLQTLVLSNNKISQINAHDFKFFPSLTRLYLDFDDLTMIDHHAFSLMKISMESLSLVSNSLQSTEFLSDVNNLLEINLDENRLKHFPKELTNASRIRSVSLRNNHIESIDELSPLFHWMNWNRSDIEVYLNANPLNCCQSRWLVQYLSGPNNFVKDMMNLTCASPTSYAGQRLIDLHADLMDCSSSPYHPANLHWSKSTIVFLSFFIVLAIIFTIIGFNLYRRGLFPFRSRHHAYEPIAGDDLPRSV